MPSILITNKCNNRCIMCTNPQDLARRREWFDPDFIFGRLEKFRKGEDVFSENFRDVFYISGGEPTLSENFPAVVKKIETLFPESKIVCLSNARRFAYPYYAKEILRLSNNFNLIIPIHAHNAEIHDSITGAPGSFKETVNGLKNIFIFKKQGQEVEIRIVIHKLNYKYLENITKFIKNEFPKIDHLVYIFFEIEAQARKNLKKIKLTYSQVRPYIKKIYGSIKLFNKVSFYHFPLCTLPPKFYPYIKRTLPDYEVAFIKTCAKCKLREYCLGVHKGYLENIGSNEFKPITKTFKIRKGKSLHEPIAGINK